MLQMNVHIQFRKNYFIAWSRDGGGIDYPHGFNSLQITNTIQMNK